MSAVVLISGAGTSTPRVRVPWLRLALVAAVAAMVSACAESSSTVTTAPSPAKCQVTLTGTSTVESAGGGASITVTTQPECLWTASTTSTWITGLAPTSGQGSGQVDYRATPNSTSAMREAEVVVNDARLRLTQQASPASCTFALAPPTQTIAAAGASGSVTVTTAAGCVWSATSNASWLTLTAPSEGAGSGTVAFNVATNAGAERVATITVGGQQATVRQSGNQSSCQYDISPAGQSFASAGGAGSPVTVTTGSSCTWTARTSETWITVTGGASGTGSGTVTFTVATNTGAARTGTISIASQTFTVSQQPAPGQTVCTYAIAPTSQTIAAAGGAGNPVTVTTQAGCSWAAGSNVSWVSVTSSATGSGNGSVTFNVAANTVAAERTGTLTIAGETFTVSQAAAPCTYSINPTSQSIASAGGAGGPVTVTAAGPNCSWTAGSNVSWITITSGATGGGNGNVAFTVESNPATIDRSGTLTIAGETFTVSQAAAQCTYTINPTSQSIAAAGGAGGPVRVTAAGPNCSWTAGSNVGWISISGGASGSGNGSVTFTVERNTVPTERSGTLTIAGQTFTVNQAAMPCTYSLSRQSHSAPAGGESSASTSVAAPAGCTWTATSNVPWVIITAGASGSGDGDVTFNVETNSSTTSGRSGTMTIAGLTFTVSQEAACGFTINPVTANQPATGGTNFTVTVTPTRSNCNWSATSNAPWLTINGGGNGTGPGTVTYNVAQNTGAARTGTLTVANQTFTVNQAAAACAYSIAPATASPPAGATANLTLTVTTNLPTCTWTAASSATWLTISTGASGIGTGPVTYNVAANPNGSGARTGTVTVTGTIPGQPFVGTHTVTQATCSFTINPTSATVPGIGGTGSVAVTANGAHCTWTATSNNTPWLRITSGATGTGNGTVNYEVVANGPGLPARVGTLTVAGRTFTLTQQAR